MAYEGIVDVARLIKFDGIFAPLRELEFFQQVDISSDLGTIYWQNGADLDPDVLYAAIQSSDLPTVETNGADFSYSQNILPALQQRFSDWLQPELTSVRILHKDDYVFLEAVHQEDGDETINRYNLFFMKFETSPHQFSPLYSPEQNAQIFLSHLDDSYLITYTVNFFTEEGYEALACQESAAT